MASEVSAMPVNGNYGSHNPYDMSSYNNAQQQHQHHHQSQHHTQQHQPYSAPQSSAPPAHAPSKSNTNTELAKDEVGWYFVEQYYKTLSGNPEKLFLFYNKRSQLVMGQEADKIDVCVGPKAINERIQHLDFQSCKIRVTNVDSQASDANIVIQVIGEISHKSQPHRKFTQTFILAAQTNGYFVLNDIFRYLVEEEDENSSTTRDNADAATTTAVSAAPAQNSAQTSAGLTSSADKTEQQQSADKVSEQIEKKASKAPEPTVMNGTHQDVPSDAVHAEDAPVAATAAKTDAASSTSDEALAPEKPVDPVPSPAAAPSPAKKDSKPAAAATSAAPVAETSAAPAKPAAPKTWASLAAAASKPKTTAAAAASSSTAAAAAPAAPAAAQATQSQAKTPVAAKSQPATTAASAPAPAVREPSPPADNQQQGGWTNVGGDHKRQQQKTQAQAAPAEDAGRAYIAKIGEDVDEQALRAYLEKFGELTQVEISRVKNCAFVDFKNPEEYRAAVAKNPHTIGSNSWKIEERRINRAPFATRGGISMRGGRGAPGQATGGRGNFQGGGRGGFPPSRGRGGAASRGRGAAQAA